MECSWTQQPARVFTIYSSYIARYKHIFTSPTNNPTQTGHRGVCQFDEKAKLANTKGASAVIVVNVDDTVFRVPSSPGGGVAKLSTSIVMISLKDGRAIQNMMVGGNAIVKFEPGTQTDPKGVVHSSR